MDECVVLILICRSLMLLRKANKYCRNIRKNKLYVVLNSCRQSVGIDNRTLQKKKKNVFLPLEIIN